MVEQPSFPPLYEPRAIDAGASALEEAARAAALGEIEAAEALCDQPIGTVLARERRFERQSIVERLRIVRPPGHLHARIWEIVEEEDGR